MTVIGNYKGKHLKIVELAEMGEGLCSLQTKYCIINKQ